MGNRVTSSRQHKTQCITHIVDDRPRLDSSNGLSNFSSEDKEIYGVTASPDGNLLAAGAKDGNIHLWNVKTGEELQVLCGHAGLVLRLTFSKDGTRLAFASFDRLAKVWDVTTGEELASLYSNASNVFGVAFSLDGKHLATAGADGTIHMYILEIEELITIAKSRLSRTLTEAECQKYLHMVEHCRNGSHARCKRHGLSRLKPAYNFLQRLPGRCAVIA